MKSQSLNVPLMLPEYGRNVQKMVKYLLTIEDKEERNRQALIVIATMANVYPHARRDTQEFRNMLYDHLFMISNFELDIDCEFEKPNAEQFSPIPEQIPYSQQGIVRKQYGALVPRMTREISIIEDPELRTTMAISLAKFMRQKSYDYNHEFPSNEIIINDIFDMSNGRIALDSSIFDGTQITTFRDRARVRQQGHSQNQSNSRSSSRPRQGSNMNSRIRKQK